MEKPLEIVIFYTYNIQGDLRLLPRLYTFIQRQRAEYSCHPLLLDLGASCAADIWHCAVTGGRSALIVLDSMGYHAANVNNVLAQEQHKKIEDAVSIGLVNQQNLWHYHMPPVIDKSILITATPISDPGARLQILLAPQKRTRIEGNVLALQAVDRGEIGITEVNLMSAPEIAAYKIRKMPPETPPNPVIVAAVDFVESEARYYEKKQQAVKNGSPES